MHTQAKSSLFFTDLSSFGFWGNRFDRVGLRDQIILKVSKGLHEQRAIQQVADGVLQIADYAYTFRQMDKLESVARFLVDAPLPRQYESIAGYYQALFVCRKVGVVPSRRLFERVVDEAPLSYRARAMASLGTTFVQTGDLQSARELYGDALRVLRDNWADPQTVILSHRMLAVTKSIEGDQRGALMYLEGLKPLARMVGQAHPHVFFEYLNSLAIELAEADRLEEAQRACRIVLASPYAFAYPECRETWDEIALRGYRMSRSVVSFAQKTKPKNILHLPERNYDTAEYSRNPFQPQASVVSLKNWKSKMVKEPNGEKDNDENLDEMDEKDLIVKLLQLTAYEGVDEKKLRKVVEYAKQIMSEPDKK